MKKELSIHFVTCFVLFLVGTILHGWLNFNYWLFWVGGIIGTILPDIDHLVYIYFLRPQELTSLRTTSMIQKHDIKGAWDLLAITRSERKDLIFHTVLFQLIFLVLAFLVLSSRANLLGRGLVLAFSWHLVLDQIIDYRSLGNIDNWFKNFPFVLYPKEQKFYIWAGVFVTTVFAILL